MRFIKSLVFSIPIFIIAFKAYALTSMQTSTALGYYRDYTQSARFPVYFSWTARSLFDHGVESSFDVVLNNDFAKNDWKALPTQAMISIPLAKAFEGATYRRSRIQLGRMFFTEGFEFSLLDGAQAPIYWTKKGGVHLAGGVIRSTDIDQSGHNVPMSSLSFFQDVWGAVLRAGVIMRDPGLKSQYYHGSLLKNFESLTFSPQLFTKQEFTENGFNQSLSELAINPTEDFMLAFTHRYSNPRPTNKKDDPNFVYKVFSITPQENLRAAAVLEISENLVLSASAQELSYKANFDIEYANQYDTSAIIRLTNHIFEPIFTYLSSYAGEIWDSGFRYKYLFDNRSQLQFEFDTAWFTKVSGVQSWAQHARMGYQSEIFQNTTGLGYVEIERNQYYEFDARVMFYVTNYL